MTGKNQSRSSNTRRATPTPPAFRPRPAAAAATTTASTASTASTPKKDDSVTTISDTKATATTAPIEVINPPIEEDDVNAEAADGDEDGNNDGDDDAVDADDQGTNGAAATSTEAAPRRRGRAPGPPKGTATIAHMQTAAAQIVARLRMFAQPGITVHMNSTSDGGQIVIRDDLRSSPTAPPVIFEVGRWSKTGWKRALKLHAKGVEAGLPPTDNVNKIMALLFQAFEAAVNRLMAARNEGALVTFERDIHTAVWGAADGGVIQGDYMFVKPHLDENQWKIEVSMPVDRALALGASKIAPHITALLALIKGTSAS